MRRVKSLYRVSELLSHFRVHVAILNANSQFDINIISEDFLIPICNIIFKSKFKNLKHEENNNNFPGIDISDRETKTCIQITSNNTFFKVKHTINKIIKYQLYDLYSHFYVILINESLENYNDSVISDLIGSKFTFNKSHVLDCSLLYKKISSLEDNDIFEIELLLEKQYGHTNNNQSSDYFPKLLDLTQDDTYNLQLNRWMTIRQNWLDKKMFLLEKEAQISDLQQKFSLDVSIKEANDKIENCNNEILTIVNKIK